MHDGAEIIIANIVPIRNMLVELTLSARDDIFPVDADMSIPILPTLLVPQTNSVANFVNGLAETAARTQGDILAVAHHPKS